MSENFVSKCISADAIIDEIYDYIDKWHDEDTNLQVYEYLGMTKDEYYLWLKDEYVLKFIIEAHRLNRDVTEYLNEESLVARASNPEEAKKIYEWLKTTGDIT